MYFTFTLFVPLLFITIYYFLSLIKFLIAIYNIPGVWITLNLQVFGIALELAGKNETERLKILQKYAELYPKAGKIWFGSMFFVYLHDPEMLRKIYTSQKCLEKPFFYKFFGFGDGLITAKTKLWKPHRKVLNNAFRMRNLQEFIFIFDESSKQFVKTLEKNLNKGPFNMLDGAVKCTLDSICCTFQNILKFIIVDLFLFVYLLFHSYVVWDKCKGSGKETKFQQSFTKVY